MARARDQREEHLWRQTTVLQLTTFTDKLIFYSDANQIRLLLQYGGDIGKKKKREAAVPKCNPAFKHGSESKLYTARRFNNSARLCQEVVGLSVASTLQCVVAYIHTYKHAH